MNTPVPWMVWAWDIFFLGIYEYPPPPTDIARVPYSTYYWNPPVCPLVRLYCRALILWPPQGKRMANQLLIRPAISGEGYLWVEVGWLAMIIDWHDFCLHFVAENMLLTVHFHFWLIKHVWQVPGTFATKHVHSSQMELYFSSWCLSQPIWTNFARQIGPSPQFSAWQQKTFQTTTQFFTPANFGCRGNIWFYTLYTQIRRRNIFQQ